MEYVDDEVIAALDDEHYGDENDAGDFETINEEEFAEGDAYEEGQVINHAVL